MNSKISIQLILNSFLNLTLLFVMACDFKHFEAPKSDNISQNSNETTNSNPTEIETENKASEDSLDSPSFFPENTATTSDVRTNTEEPIETTSHPSETAPSETQETQLETTTPIESQSREWISFLENGVTLAEHPNLKPILHLEDLCLNKQCQGNSIIPAQDVKLNGSELILPAFSDNLVAKAFSIILSDEAVFYQNKEVTANLSDAINEQEHIISKENFKLRSIKNWRQNETLHASTMNQIKIGDFINRNPKERAELLLEDDSQVLPETEPDGAWTPPVLTKSFKVHLSLNQPKVIWFSAKIPKNTVPGEYRLQLDLSSEGNYLARIPINLKVYDIPLVETEKNFVLSYAPQLKKEADGSMPLLKSEIDNILDHGINTIKIGSFQESWGAFDPNPLIEKLAPNGLASDNRGFKKIIINWTENHFFNNPIYPNYLETLVTSYQNHFEGALTFKIEDEINSIERQTRYLDSTKKILELAESSLIGFDPGNPSVKTSTTLMRDTVEKLEDTDCSNGCLYQEAINYSLDPDNNPLTANPLGLFEFTGGQDTLDNFLNKKFLLHEPYYAVGNLQVCLTNRLGKPIIAPVNQKSWDYIQLLRSSDVLPNRISTSDGAYWGSSEETPSLQRMQSGFFFFNTRFDAQYLFSYAFASKNPTGQIRNPFKEIRSAPVDPNHLQDTLYQFALFDPNNWAEINYKASYTVYPASNGVIDTLQWEGVREGILDYKIAATFNTLANKAVYNGCLNNPDCATLLETNCKNLNALLAPYLNPRNFDNETPQVFSVDRSACINETDAQGLVISKSIQNQEDTRQSLINMILDFQNEGFRIQEGEAETNLFVCDSYR